MKLVAVVMSGDVIRDTLVAIGVSARPPPIAPPKSRGLFAFDEFSNSTFERTDNSEPFADW
jgi:hypothetical protein